jgi:hypothetical protein
MHVKILPRPKYENTNTLTDLHITIKNLFDRIQKQKFIFPWAKTILLLSIINPYIITYQVVFRFLNESMVMLH